MCIFVPFDGSDHAKLALDRGAELATCFDTDLLAIAVIHRGVDDPVKLGWLEPDERFDPALVARRLEAIVDHEAPMAEFQAINETARLSRGAVAKRLRRFARREDADMVVMGSENAGRIVTPLSSVGGSVAADRAYDVLLVRRADSGLFDDGRRTA